MPCHHLLLVLFFFISLPPFPYWHRHLDPPHHLLLLLFLLFLLLLPLPSCSNVVDNLSHRCTQVATPSIPAPSLFLHGATTRLATIASTFFLTTVLSLAMPTTLQQLILLSPTITSPLVSRLFLLYHDLSAPQSLLCLCHAPLCKIRKKELQQKLTTYIRVKNTPCTHAKPKRPE